MYKLIKEYIRLLFSDNTEAREELLESIHKQQKQSAKRTVDRVLKQP